MLPTVVQELAALYLDGLDAADARGARRDVRAAPRDALAARRACVPGEPPPAAFERLRGAAVRRARPRGPRGPRHGPRGGRRAAARDATRCATGAYRAAGVAADPRASSTARPAPARWASLADMIAARRGAAGARGVLPVLGPALRGRDRAARRPRRDPGDRRPPRAAPSSVALMREWWDARARRVPGRAQPARRGRRLHDPVRAGRGAAARCSPRDPICAPWRRHLREPPGPARPARPRSPASRSPTAPAPRRRRASPRCCATSSAPRWRPARRCGASTRYARGDELLAQLAPLGFAPLPDCRRRRLGGAACRPIRCDLGPESVGGLAVAALAARDLPVAGRRARRGRARARARRPADQRSRSSSATSCATCATARGRAVAREALLRDVWGYEWTGGSNVVEVAVSGLRRKLGPTARQRSRRCAASATGCGRSAMRGRAPRRARAGSAPASPGSTSCGRRAAASRRAPAPSGRASRRGRSPTRARCRTA